MSQNAESSRGKSTRREERADAPAERLVEQSEPEKRHGDALLDGTGSRQGEPDAARAGDENQGGSGENAASERGIP